MGDMDVNALFYKSEDYLQHFADIVIREAALSVEQWTVKIITSGGGLLVRASLEIWIDEAHTSHPYMLLHELAHIKCPEHDVFWGDLFTALCTDYADIWDCLPGRGVRVLVDRDNPQAQCWQVWPDENGDHRLVALDEHQAGKHFITEEQIDKAWKMAQHAGGCMRELGIVACEKCGGSGETESRTGSMKEEPMLWSCPDCHGKGWVIK